MHQHTLAELSQKLAKKEISSLELTQYYLDRIERHNPILNSFTTLCRSEAEAQAREADAARASGDGRPLLGIPFAHKDNFCTLGVKTTCGSKMLEHFIAPYDATVVKKLHGAGTVLLGKLNMDEFAMGSSNENSYFGPVRNPWDLERVPGGSSGGSTCAVAAGLTPGATGTDTGGSIRQPAALCGVTGLKPTYGCVSRYGVVAYASSLDQAGPIAKTAEDCALLLEAIAGCDDRDATCARFERPAYAQHLNMPLEGMRIGVPDAFFEGLDAAMQSLLQNALNLYAQMGAVLVPITFDHLALSLPAYYILAPAEASSNLARYDGVRYGYRCAAPKDLRDLYCRSRSEGFGNEVKRRIMIGTYVLSAGFYDAFYLKAQKTRNLIRKDFLSAFEKVDVIFAPTAPSPAFKIGEKTSDPISMYLSDIYTIPANLAGIPSISVPCGFLEGLPVGFQLMGRAFDEVRILSAAHQYQCQTDWHRQSPEWSSGVLSHAF